MNKLVKFLSHRAYRVLEDKLLIIATTGILLQLLYIIKDQLKSTPGLDTTPRIILAIILALPFLFQTKITKYLGTWLFVGLGLSLPVFFAYKASLPEATLYHISAFVSVGFFFGMFANFSLGLMLMVASGVYFGISGEITGISCVGFVISNVLMFMLMQVVEERSMAQAEAEEIKKFLATMKQKRINDLPNLSSLSTEDPLTLLPNRYSFDKSLAISLVEAKRGGTNLGLFYVELKNLGDINSKCSIEMGDTLLCAFRDLLKNNVREHDIIGKVGGGVFGIILKNLQHKDNIDLVKNRLLSLAATTNWMCNGIKIDIDIAIGTAYYPEDETSERGLMVVANHFLYEDLKEEYNENSK